MKRWPLAIVVVAMASAGCVEPASDPARELAIKSGDTVAVDWTAFLDGRPWKTTVPWIARLLVPDNQSIVEADFTPTRLVAGSANPSNPLLSGVARAVVGHASGDRFRVELLDAFGASSETSEVKLPRVWGPFDRESEWPRDSFAARFGDPHVGKSFASNVLFNSTVTAIHPDTILSATEAQEGDVIALPFLNAFLRVEAANDQQISFRLDPIRNVSFRVPAAAGHVGLEPGHYMVVDLDAEWITFQHHPMWSPVLVGRDFLLDVEVVERDTELNKTNEEA